MKSISTRSSLQLLALVWLFFGYNGIASQIRPLPLAELEKRSDLIVMAKVLSVEPTGSLDQVVIRVSSLLKGETDAKRIELTLQVRGGLKEWDPKLKAQDTGVFFMRKEQDGSYRVAYPGSISVFPAGIYSKD